MNHLQGLHVLILGLGDSGLAMARWCARCGASVAVADTRAAPPQAGRLHADVPTAQLHPAPVAGQGLDAALLDGVQLVLKSPGLAPADPAIAPLLVRADERGIPVRGELSLFASALADLKADRGYAPHVIAITGTNGKTTTTALTALLVERAGQRVGLAGNIGPTLLDTLAAALDLEPPPAAAEAAVHATPGSGEDPIGPPAPVAADAEPWVAAGPDTVDDLPEEALQADAAVHAEIDAEQAAGLLPIAPPPPPAPMFEHLPQVWVLELSSFQLDGVSNFEPSAATVLNLSQDHLDWHGTMAAYAQAKARIFGRQAVMVINRDDPQVEALVPAPEVLKPAVKGRPARTVSRTVVRFGLDAPRRAGDFGVVHEGGIAWMVRARESDETGRRKTRSAAEDDEEPMLQRLMPADALRIRGRHNAANALAALALATAIGCPLAPMLHGLREYRGEPHRVEPVGSIGEVQFYDDSKGTNVGATVAALNGLGADIEPARIVVILGGDGKGQDFSPLAAPVARHVRAVALIGRDAPAIEAALSEAAGSAGIAMQRHDSLEAATQWAAQQARERDAVLLSPACASLDMFRNYAHRAEVFVATVKTLAEDRGEWLS